MKKQYLFFIFLLIASINNKSFAQFPQAEIKNSLIQARLFLPDATKGYYRGARFDWAGVISSLEYYGHQYFGQWFEKYSPTLHDAIMGPVDAFYPVGFDDAKAGEQFLKIGVGMLVKQQDPKYFIATPYEIANSGQWKVKKKSNRVIFTHKLEANGYGYLYTKTVELVKGKPALTLSCSLKNTGTRPIETNVYNHNFFVMDQVTTGPDYVVTFPFPVTGELTSGKDLGRLVGNQLIYEKPFVKGNTVFSPGLLGFGPDAKDYDIRIENQKTGAAVRITGDQPLLKMVFWSAFKTVCPEPYIAINVNPGESKKWNINYEFYINDVKK
ncbi:MAG: hypothetical protein SH818_06170 [Saprospiraceae bacterium]|nr:hypothetical protein [Saprospiraceae bacterium]